MSALGVATIAVYCGLALVAFGFGFLSRGYSRAGLAIGLAGLLPLTAGTTWLVRTWPAAIAEDGGGLKGELTALKVQVRKLEVERDGERTRAERAEREGTSAQLEKAGLEKDLSDIRRKLRDAEEKLAKAASDAPPQPKQPVVAVGTSPVTCPERPACPVERRPAAPPQLDVRAFLDKRLMTPFYSSEPLPQSELVSGHVGRWYLLRPRLGDEPLAFRGGAYTLPDEAAFMDASLTRIVQDIVAPVQRSERKYRIFVRGGADQSPLTRPVEPAPIAEIKVLPRLAGNGYGAQPQMHRIGEPVRNEDLPVLRADWLRQQLSPHLSIVVPKADVAILDEPPGPGRGRAAEILMFVAW